MSDQNLFIPVILGTARKDRESEAAAKYVFEQVQKYGVGTEYVDVRSMAIEATTPSWVEDNKADEWRELAAKSDGFVFVVPEYNRGYPGELKMLIDRALSEYKYKPVMVCGVSSGGFGGARVVENLLGVWVTMNMVPIKSSVFFSGIADLFDESGKITDDSYAERIAGMMDEMIWFAKTLKQARSTKAKVTTTK